MKRFHVNVAVADLPASVQFYSSMFGIGPTMEKADYAQWMLDDPLLNFSLSASSTEAGVNHLGIQVESDEALAGVHDQFHQAAGQVLDQPDTQCCYARSSKHWTRDPDGVRWEAFHTHERIDEYGSDPTDERCCETAEQKPCCVSGE